MSGTDDLNWHDAIKVSKLKNGKKKMLRVNGKMILLGMHEGAYFATEALCRHMRWPLAWGGKVKDGCIRCPLHQTTHQIADGELVEWAPFPLFPPFGKVVGKLSKQKDLQVYPTRVLESKIQIQF